MLRVRTMSAMITGINRDQSSSATAMCSNAEEHETIFTALFCNVLRWVILSEVVSSFFFLFYLVASIIIPKIP